MSSDGSESCLDNGSEGSTCEDYGKMVQCGDGVCTNGETCVCADCAVFCIPGPMPIGLADEFPEPGPGYDDGAMAEACESAKELEYAESWDCPDWQYVSGLTNEENPLCSELATRRDYQQFLWNEGQVLGNQLKSENSCTTNDTRSVCVKAEGFLNRSEQAKDEYDRLNAIPCYLYNQLRR
jgi:hypothetical protein